MNAPASSPGRRAGADELARLFSPRSIAVIGASADPAKFNGRFVPYLLRHGFAGRLYPINARRDEIAGVRCWPDLASVPGEVDCVIHAAAAADTLQALEACEAKRVRLIVTTSAGFAERGDDEGRRLEAELVALAHRAGARVLGPNCVGFLNAVDGIAAAAAAAFEWAPPLPSGRIGVASQSGGLAMASIILGGWSEGIGFSHVLNTGNESDLDVADAVRFLVGDPHTDAICLTVEAVRDGAAFVDALREAQRADKPVVVLKTGRSELGRQMAASHTGALAGSHPVFEAVARAYGATLVDDLDDLWQVAAMFAKLRGAGRLVPRGDRPIGAGCSACSVSGGHIGLLADLAAEAGMRFPALSEPTQDRLREALGKSGPIANPVDMSGGSVSDHGTWARTLTPLLEDPSIEVALPILTAAKNYDTVCADLHRLAEQHDKPIVVTWAGASFQGEGKRALQRGPLPLFWTPGRTARALVSLDAWQRSRADARAPRPVRPPVAVHPSVAAAARAGRPALTERESKAVLHELGFGVTRERLSGSADEAVAIANELGYPVVLKGEHPSIAHKTEAGLVALGLNDEAQVRSAWARIAGRMAASQPEVAAHGVLVAEQVPPGIELVMGARRDPVFGPVVLFGVGGVFVEALGDVRLAPAGIGPTQARALIEGIRSVALLRGARGRAPADLDLLAHLLCRLGDFALSHAAIVGDIDVNPLVLPDRPGAAPCALDALIVLGEP
jgi:acetyltransferase